MENITKVSRTLEDETDTLLLGVILDPETQDENASIVNFAETSGSIIISSEKDTLTGKDKILKPGELVSYPGIKSIIDLRSGEDRGLADLAAKNNIPYMYGEPARVVRGILKTWSVTSGKDKEFMDFLDNKLKQLNLFYELALAVASPLNLLSLMGMVLAMMMRHLKMQSGAIFLYDEERERFVCRFQQGDPDNSMEELELSLSDPLTEELLTLSHSIIVEDISRGPASSLTYALMRGQFVSMIAIPLQFKDRLLGILVLADRENDNIEQNISILDSLGGQIAIAVENARLFESLKEKNIQVESLVSKLIQAQEEERKRVAAEIHDGVAQSLVGIKTQLQMIKNRLVDDPSDAMEKVDKLMEITGENIKEVRNIMYNLRPASLDDLGLIASVENLLQRVGRDKDIEIEFITNRNDIRLSPVVEITIFRVVQEAVNNILRHSGSNKAWIRMNFDPSRLRLEIVDDGKGISQEELSARLKESRRFGLQGMRERVQMVEGKFNFITNPGKGSIVDVEIPMTRSS
ncbi:MAG: sensor histidine kinase [Chloroflexi bacterium]|nr:sensor histidine kinase [Chloroflexota bacterium]